MKQYQAILFDLDGTLLPMDLEEFTQVYLTLLSKRFAPEDPKMFIAAVWQGTKAMMTNDGSVTNETRFWDVFSGLMGREVLDRQEEFEDFYRREFHGAKAVCGENPVARAVIDLAHEKAEKVILATNPLFPPCAVESRLSWVGLKPGDFDYITTYDNSSACKPTASYYETICKANGLTPARCLMVGNDLKEDAWGTGQLGIPSYIATDCLIEHGLNLADWNHGTFAALLERL